MIGQSRRARLLLIQLMCVSFAVCWLTSVHLFDIQAITQLDVWFETDPDEFMLDRGEIAKVVLRHPNFRLFVEAPVWLAGKILSRLGVAADSPIELRNWLLLLLAPIAGAVRTMAAFRAISAVTSNLFLTALLCLLDIVAFQAVAIGSVPESFALSAACIALMYWTMEADARLPRVRSALLWIGLGTFAAGVTLTNVAPFAVLWGTALYRRRRSWLRVAVIVGGGALVAVGVNVATLFMRHVVNRGLLFENGLAGTLHWIHSPGIGGIRELLWSMAHTFVAPMPAFVSGSAPQPTNPDYDFHILYPPTFDHAFPSAWRAALTLCMLGLGIAGYLCRRETRTLLLPAAVIAGGNLLLHLFYGHYYFLYGLHWQLSLVWLLAGIAFLPIRVRRFATGALAMFLLVTAANSWLLMSQLLTALRSA